MLFHVEMTVNIPHDIPKEEVERLKATERAQAHELQRSGEWRNLWRIAGRFANVSIFDVASPQALHGRCHLNLNSDERETFGLGD